MLVIEGVYLLKIPLQTYVILSAQDLRDINLAEKFNFISPQPKIAIFLSTYEGQNFLVDQLDSILNQNYSKWKIYARDDCSTDNTFSILQRFHKTHLSKIDIKSNQKNSGFISNFLSMVCDQTIQADLYAYADQDDVWEEDKLQMTDQLKPK